MRILEATQGAGDEGVGRAAGLGLRPGLLSPTFLRTVCSLALRLGAAQLVRGAALQQLGPGAGPWGCQLSPRSSRPTQLWLCQF